MINLPRILRKSKPGNDDDLKIIRNWKEYTPDRKNMTYLMFELEMHEPGGQVLHFYKAIKLARIIRRSAGILGQPCTEEGALELAKCSRGTPRVANRLLKRVRDFAVVLGDGTVDGDAARLALKRMDIDALGLDELDRSLLRAIIELYGGGPVGLDTLAAALGEEAVTLEDVCEPYLMQMGFLTRTPRGRCVTRLAYDHLGMRAPTFAEENGQQSMF